MSLNLMFFNYTIRTKKKIAKIGRGDVLINSSSYGFQCLDNAGHSTRWRGRTELYNHFPLPGTEPLHDKTFKILKKLLVYIVDAWQLLVCQLDFSFHLVSLSRMNNSITRSFVKVLK